MKTIKPLNTKPLSDIVQSSQEAIHNFSDHARATAAKSRRRLDYRHRNVLLRELGQLHYDAHHTGTDPDPDSIGRLMKQLDAESAPEGDDDVVDA